MCERINIQINFIEKKKHERATDESGILYTLLKQLLKTKAPAIA